MYPNPQDALPLPPLPNLEQYKKLAKDLVKVCKSSDEDALGRWATKWFLTLARLDGGSYTAMPQHKVDQVEEFARGKLRACALASAQFVIARAHGFESWPKLAKHIEGLARESSPVSQFESAADAIVTGDVTTLERLLQESPELIRMRSTREHGATLLHYVSANGVEGYRQKTPPNAVMVAAILLKAGAEVDATADVYGGGATTLLLAATSVHPERAGVQIPLLQLLLDQGASIDSGGHGAVVDCLANGRPRAAEFLASRGARLDLEGAAGVGRLDVVERFFKNDANVTRDQMQAGFQWACEYGRNTVVEFLLEKGADPNAPDDNGQTALHWAAIGGQLDTIKLLLKRNVSLEARNSYGGTVLGQTLWSAAHGGDADVYAAIIEALVAAGAQLPDRHTPVNQRIDELLLRYESHAEPSFYWYGEEPMRPRS